MYCKFYKKEAEIMEKQTVEDLYDALMFYGVFCKDFPACNVIYNIIFNKYSSSNGGQICDMQIGPCSCGAWH